MAPKLLRHTSSPGAPSLTDIGVFSCAQFVILCFVFSGVSVTPLSSQLLQFSATGQQEQTSAPTTLSKTILRVALTDEELKTWDIALKPSTHLYNGEVADLNVNMEVKVSFCPCHIGKLGWFMHTCVNLVHGEDG